MRRIRRVLIATLGVLGSAAAGTLLSVGCGGGDDSSSHMTDAAADSTTDASHDSGMTTDASPHADGEADAEADADSSTTLHDGGTDASDGAASDGGDATVVTDGATDASVVDAQGDVLATGDAADAGSDAPYINQALVTFQQQAANTYCGQLEKCCGFAADASTFNMSLCISRFTPFGYGGTLQLQGAAGLIDSGVLVVDQTKAQACLADMAAIDCSANVLSTQANLQTLADCTAAVSGTVPANGPCTASIACAGSQYCSIPSGATSGTCVPLSGDGGACNSGGDMFIDLNASELLCSSRGTSTNGLRCNNQDLNSPYLPLDAGTWACAPTLGANSLCNVDSDCASALCDSVNYVCVSSTQFVAPSTCANYTIKDAGGGG
jgi:hypothetical protein